MIASPIGVAFDKSKGSMGNRVDCAKEHYGNNLTAGLKIDAVILAGAGVTYAANKNSAVRAVFSSIERPIKALFTPEKYAIAKESLKPVVEFAKSAPTSVKLAVGALTALITCKAIFRQGQIDQKYTDRAQAQKNLSV